VCPEDDVLSVVNPIAQWSERAVPRWKTREHATHNLKIAERTALGPLAFADPVAHPAAAVAAAAARGGFGVHCTAPAAALSLSSLRCDMHTEATAQGVREPGPEAMVPGLVICAPGGRQFTPGAAMHLSCVWGFLGVLTPTFSMDKAGKVMHIDRFDASRLLLSDPRNLGSWLLYEICAFMCAQLPHVAVLRFTLSRPLDGLGTASEQVLMRMKVLDIIGAEVSGFSVRGASMHVIEGLWRPSPENLRRLAAALTDHRDALRLAPMQVAHETDGRSSSMSLRERLDTVRRLVAG
jgi:hypothetical protein